FESAFEFGTPKNFPICSGCSIITVTKWLSLPHKLNEDNCAACSNGTVPSASRFSCQCPEDSVIIKVTPNGLQCQQCAQGLYPSSDRLECLPCKSSNCCPKGSVYNNRNVDGSLLNSMINDANSTIPQDNLCVKCLDGTVPNADSTSCVPCGTLDCYCELTPSQCTSSDTPKSFNTEIHLISGKAVKSVLLERLLNKTASRCGAGNQESCQQLANFCVLQNFDTSSGTACDVIEKLRDRRIENSIPLVFFPGDADTELYRETAITQRFMFDTDDDKGQLEIILMRYALNGTFQGIVKAESVLQPCAPKEVRRAFKFGRRYGLTCDIALEWLTSKSDIEFFEAFIKFFDKDGNPQLYPIAIVNSLIRSTSGLYLNQQDRRSWVLTRRFFYSDGISYVSNPIGNVRYASDIHLHVEMKETRNGFIFPPYLSIFYMESDYNLSDIITMRFSVTYDIDPSRHNQAS
ncbi:hypothetical protein DICVIV_01473, partial [Dictyocaulus viviparus]